MNSTLPKLASGPAKVVQLADYILSKMVSVPASTSEMVGVPASPASFTRQMVGVPASPPTFI